MVRNLIISLVLLCVNFSYTLAQNNERESRLRLIEANELYRQGDFQGAIKMYNSAISLNPANDKGKYNIGNSMYRSNNYKEAAEQFENYAQSIKNPNEKARAYHNLGNSYLMANELDKAISAYKQALKNNPDDEDTRYNLSYALQQKKKQKEKQNEKENESEKEKQNENEKEKEKEKQNENEKEKQNESEKQNKEGNQNNGNKEKPSKEQAKKMLDALNKNEKKMQEKMNKEKGVPVYTGGNDW